MKITRKLIEALISEEKRVKFKTSYMDKECDVLIGEDYFVVKFPDGTMLQQNRRDIEEGLCFPFDDEIETYTSLKGVLVQGRFHLNHFANLQTT